MGKHWGSFYVCAFFNDHRGAEPFRTALINKAPERPEAIRAQATAIPPSCIGCHGTMPWPSGTGSWPHQVSPLASADHCGPRRRQPCGLQASRAVCRRAVSGKRRDDGRGTLREFAMGHAKAHGWEGRPIAVGLRGQRDFVVRGSCCEGPVQSVPTPCHAAAWLSEQCRSACEEAQFLCKCRCTLEWLPQSSSALHFL